MVEGPLASWPVINKNGIFFWFLRNVVTVRFTFFLTAVILGLRIGSPLALAIWIAVVFVAILLHECGHAFAARFYGQKPQIELHAMGGVTKWAWVDHLQWWKRVLISLAGPAIGFVVGGVVWAVTWAWPVDWSYALWVARYQFLFATVAWGAFNLLPMLPLDGGQALTEYLEHRMGRDAGRTLGRKVSFATGILGLAVGLLLGETWAALLCGMFAFDNYQQMQGLPGVRLPT